MRAAILRWAVGQLLETPVSICVSHKYRLTVEMHSISARKSTNPPTAGRASLCLLLLQARQAPWLLAAAAAGSRPVAAVAWPSASRFLASSLPTPWTSEPGSNLSVSNYADFLIWAWRGPWREGRGPPRPVLHSFAAFAALR